MVESFAVVAVPELVCGLTPELGSFRSAGLPLAWRPVVE
jgi:hypothetical protein